MPAVGRGLSLERSCLFWFCFWGSSFGDATLTPFPPLHSLPLRHQARRGIASRAPAKAAGKFELTEEQKQEIREAFDLFDTDGSGEFGWFSRFLFVWGCRHNHTRGV